MAKRGIDYEEERAHDLLAAYRGYLCACETVRMSDVWAAVVEWPAARFYVSEDRAWRVVRRLLKGGRLGRMGKERRAMFEEILRRVVKLRRREPHRTLRSLCREVVGQQAPRFYLSPSSAKAIILKMKKLKN